MVKPQLSLDNVKLFTCWDTFVKEKLESKVDKFIRSPEYLSYHIISWLLCWTLPRIPANTNIQYFGYCMLIWHNSMHLTLYFEVLWCSSTVPRKSCYVQGHVFPALMQLIWCAQNIWISSQMDYISKHVIFWSFSHKFDFVLC